MDDERHTVAAAIDYSAAQLLTVRRWQDFSIPLAMWDRYLMEVTQLDEWGLRAPVLVLGLLMLLLAGLYAWRRFGPVVGVLVAWLVAANPILILYSRFARPYVGVALLSAMTLGACECHWRGSTWRSAILAALTGAFGLLLSPTAAPAVLCMWCGLIGIAIVKRVGRGGAHSSADHSASLPRASAPLLIGSVLVTLMYLPGSESWLSQMQEKAGQVAQSYTTWYDAWLACFGVRSIAISIWLMCSLALGAVASLRRDTTLGIFLLAVECAQIIAMWYVEPLGGHAPTTLARYVIAAVPAALLQMAIGIEVQSRLVARLVPRGLPRRAMLGLLVLIVAVLLLANTPPPRPFSAPNAFTSHKFYFEPPRWVIQEDRVPRFYRFLADAAHDEAVIEAPWVPYWRLCLYGAYQERHGHNVSCVTTDPVFASRRLGFRTVFPPTMQRLHDSGAAYIVVHRDVLQELVGVASADWDRPLEPRANRLRQEAQEILAFCKSAEGLKQVFQDRYITVFALSAEAFQTADAWLRSSSE